MRDEKIHEKIERAYMAWLKRRGFQAREGQQLMMDFIFETLLTNSERKIGVVEAGTGTGKTIAYLAATIPIAQATQKTVVVVTQTIALQSQIVEQDLPDLRANSTLDFRYQLVKGRSRYMCPMLLQTKCQRMKNQRHLINKDNSDGSKILRRLYRQFERGTWDGDFDTLAQGITTDVRKSITMDRRGCLRHNCDLYHVCPYYRARNDFDEVDVIVINYALLSLSIRLENRLLPDLDQCIFVLDEAHHFAEWTVKAHTYSFSIGEVRDWHKQTDDLLSEMPFRKQMQYLCDQYARKSLEIEPLLSELVNRLVVLEYKDQYQGTRRCLLPLGEVPVELSKACQSLADYFSAQLKTLSEIESELQSRYGEAKTGIGAQGQQENNYVQVLSRLGGQIEFADDVVGGALRYSRPNLNDCIARWVLYIENAELEDWELTCSPFEVGDRLEKSFWRECGGVVCTSAVLCTNTSKTAFDYFLNQTGLPRETHSLRIPSPFDYQNQAVLHIPQMRSNPSMGHVYEKELAEKLPDCLAIEKSALVLFSSWNMLRVIKDTMPKRILDQCLVQDSFGNELLIRKHRAKIDRDESSYILGVHSFYEGIDLPGDYCRHVIIVRLPFTEPSDPILKSRSDFLERQIGHKGAGFSQISIPQVQSRLLQACGRLIRNEHDTGRITIFDQRIRTKYYGEQLLAALPPFKLQIDDVGAARAT